MSVWMIAGPPVGMAGAIQCQLVAAGEDVVSVLPSSSWTPLRNHRCGVVGVDIDSPSDTDAAVTRIAARFGQVDYLINAPWPVPGRSAASSRVRVHPFGIVNMTRAVAHVFRAQRHGHVINLHTPSSAASPTAPVGCTSFDASALGHAIRIQLAPYGAGLTVVESVGGAPRSSWDQAATQTLAAVSLPSPPQLLQLRPDAAATV
ncbi:SDR family NAD(P)-dependent oxidoreductase [Gordonia sp. NPDC058843]|uniref:SDR family NAD(P)-dependent oxidoreductase n=1 Tax=Gordonia sp. NPDC058843 TaxID=3346648 RepID=UPI00368AB98E